MPTSHSAARHLSALTSALVRKSVWIFGGDGWAYDIGFGGLDHVLSSGRDVNILVLDTEVYSNTGGQASKSTQRGAMAKFAAAGKESAKKDLGAVARSYGNVYVAQISMGANDTQATKALLEAEAYPGTSLVIAYSTCIAHGIDMAKSMTHQKDAVRSGYWPLYRFHPSPAESGQPFQLDSKAPSIPLADFIATEARYATLARTHPHQAARLAALAQADVTERWRYYEQLAGVHRTVPSGLRGRTRGRLRCRVPIRRGGAVMPGADKRGPEDDLSRPRAVLADRRLGEPAHRARRRMPRPRRRRRRGHRAAVACSRRRSSPKRSGCRPPSRRAAGTSPRPSTTFPPSPSSRAPSTSTSSCSSTSRRQSTYR